MPALQHELTAAQEPSRSSQRPKPAPARRPTLRAVAVVSEEEVMSRRQTEAWLDKGIYSTTGVHVKDGEVGKMAFRESARRCLGALAGAHAEIAVVRDQDTVSLIFADGSCYQTRVRGVGAIRKAQAEIVRFNLQSAAAGR
jgi:hypothetical protein